MWAYRPNFAPQNIISCTKRKINTISEKKRKKFEKTLKKASAISKIASQIISNGNLVLRAKELEVTMNGRNDTSFPKMLEG